MLQSRTARRIAAVAAAVLTVPTTLAISTGPASAAAQCVFTPKPPARITIGQDVVGMRTPLRVNRSMCAPNMSVDTELVHGTDSYMLMWDNLQPDVESVYAWEIVPGTYRTTANDCSAYDNNFNDYSCSVTNASTVIKFASRTSLSVQRGGSTVGFAVRSKRYSDFNGFAGAATPIRIQRYGNGAWHTIRSATTSRAGRTSWSYRHSGRAKYRAVTPESAKAFASTSTSINK
jgi:hypothetical protein